MCEKDLEDDIPPAWWLTSSNCFYLLAALVHRHNPDISKEATDAPTGATRGEIRRQNQLVRADAITAAKSGPGTVRGQAEESMLTTKAILMKKTIELQETEAIREQLNLVERFKDSFVNMNDSTAYDSAVNDMLHELPFLKKRKMTTVTTETTTNANDSTTDTLNSNRL